ncbi:MAG TPA: carboxypeptidase-like regulatory domain-containing protein [Terriglobales bacterium]
MLARTRDVLLLSLTLLFANLMYGQGGANGTILGTVTDNSGAVVAGANVDVTNTATNVTSHTQTTSSGDFTIPFLSPGTYTVTVQAPGFQKSVTNSVPLVVGQQQRVNVAMKTGAVTETVEVQASAIALDTDTSAVTQTVTPTQIEQLPLQNRNFVGLLFIGAQTVNNFRFGRLEPIAIEGGNPITTSQASSDAPCQR